MQVENVLRDVEEEEVLEQVIRLLYQTNQLLSRRD